MAGVPTTGASSRRYDVAERAHAGALIYENKIANEIGIPATASAIHESRQYQVLKSHPRALRGFKASKAHGAWNLGDISDDDDTTNKAVTSSYAQRLERLKSLQAEGQSLQLAYQDSTTSVGSRDLDPHSEQRIVPMFHLHQSHKQSRSITNVHMAIHTIPGGAILAPPLGPTPQRMMFDDPLLLDMQVPAEYLPLIMPLRLLPEAMERCHKALTEGKKYVVPGSEIEIPAEIVIPPWQLKDGGLELLDAPNVDAGRAFWFTYHAVKDSPYAQKHKMELEFDSLQPVGADAELLREGHSSFRLEFRVGIKEKHDHKRGQAVVTLEQLGSTPQDKQRKSPFHPHRLHKALILYDENFEYGYCLPASELLPEYWHGRRNIRIPRHKVAEFRFTIAEAADWFGQVHERIISKNHDSKRPLHEIPKDAIPAVYGPAMDGYADSEARAEERSEEEVQKENEEKLRRLKSYPWWKVERWNRECAHKGHGIFLPVGRLSRAATVVYFPFQWSRTDKIVYFATQQLPIGLHQVDISPYIPVLPIRMFNFYHDGLTGSRFWPTKIPGFHLDAGPFPFLCYAEGSGYSERDVPTSGMLFPSEHIKYDLLNKKMSDRLGETVESARDFVRVKKERGDSKAAIIHAVADVTDVRECLQEASSLYQIRERHFVDAVDAFMRSHSKDQRPLQWIDMKGKMMAEQQYVVSAKQMWQALADEWLVNNYMENPAVYLDGVSRPTDEELDDLTLNEGSGEEDEA